VLDVLAEVADRQFGVFTTAQALAAGYSREEIRSALRSRAWTWCRRGVYCATETAEAARSRPREAHLLAVAAVRVTLDRPVVVSHASAAVVHDLVVPARSPAEVRLTDAGNWRRGRGYRVGQGQVAPGEVTSWGPFEVTTVARTLVDCAREWSLTESVIAMDDALHRDLVDVAALREAVLLARHWEGVAGAARAAGLVDGASESPLESAGRVRIVTSGLPAPELQVELWDGGGLIGRVDAWYDDAAVAVEFDGAVKYLDPRDGRTPGEVLWREKRREDRMRAAGVRLVRLTWEDLGPGWPVARARLRELLAAPYVGRRDFRVVRRRPLLAG